MPEIRTIGIISKPDVAAAANLIPKLLAWIKERKIQVRCDQQTADYGFGCDGIAREQVPEGCDLVIVLGGDGTLLSAARATVRAEVPLFAVNLGGLGFLTAITIDEVFAELERALRGEHRIGKRRLLHTDVFRKDACVASYEALNDVVITKASLARMIDLETFVDNHFVCAYKADGLIIATPTGSTAYSLSAGGPIIFPTVAAIAITPICPHMLTNRPVIVADSSVIQMISHADNDAAYLTIDGQVGEPLKKEDCVVCRSSPKALSLIRPPRMMFFDVLRQKLKWGER